jgi:membrane-bound lytic murein transglycosylase A
VPYHSRAEIEGGALAGRELELLWVDDAIAKFFLQIQGSGQVRLDDGRVVRVGYATQNGHPYRAIGRDLIEIGALTRDEVSLQTIRAWLQAHPRDAAAIMARNRSYIFFQEHPELAAADGPLGAQGVPLTAGRSLAVDRRYVPLGVPLWLETSVPAPEGPAPLRRLMVAQDTGGAIKGVVRGDVFWGGGERAEAVAGRMKSTGRYAVLLPRALVPTS